ncbi:RagB/SusD family nutrient uptake outer membrane protein [Flavitalea sp. BT771]|uniref:RagB/SusD family nutrient uptake outer membrane protein n=1 Tax=Flavitalea sp. BT771 TaxID=3063329 RepID=UPI0026E3E228|nr:RagB/SusD family nutrient uptake outer membrane protein [Flavitalea sp. BT771]MDO6429056.1 RagB/SusD family nutrient uptake outer membrane protein [Flavitalea sp. BT771]MDV6218816.1 RagB/SusD family nutrient uptake outer membrane protein [Flavitalea sp. BT771]
MKNLDTKPQTIQTDIHNFSDLTAVGAGAYAGLKNDRYYGNSSMAWSSLPDIMGDDFIEAYESLGDWENESRWQYSADDPLISGAFSQAYVVISAANNVIQNCKGYESGSTLTGAFQLEAQARALRAHCHFDLLRYYAQSYQRNSDSLGVPYVTVFSPDNPLAAKPSRISVKNCYDSIYNDLYRALDIYRQYGDVNNPERFFIDSTCIHAMLARIGLYNGQYAQAAADASVVIGKLPLANTTDYPQIWLDNSLSEIVWQIPSDQTMRPGRCNNGLHAAYRVANNFRDLVYSPAGGIRNDTNVIRRDILGTGNVNRTSLFKYVGTRNFKVYRTSEMLLIRAECKFRQSSGAGLDDLNTLRAARGVAAGTETGNDVFNAIFTERRLELIGEGHRWFDLRRTSRTIDRDECGSAGGSLSNVCSLGPDSRSWIWPIPFNEIKLNNNLAQNGGY